jgi:hypothetical protein
MQNQITEFDKELAINESLFRHMQASTYESSSVVSLLAELDELKFKYNSIEREKDSLYKTGENRKILDKIKERLTQLESDVIAIDNKQRQRIVRLNEENENNRESLFAENQQIKAEPVKCTNEVISRLQNQLSETTEKEKSVAGKRRQTFDRKNCPVTGDDLIEDLDNLDELDMAQPLTKRPRGSLSFSLDTSSMASSTTHADNDDAASLETPVPKSLPAKSVPHKLDLALTSPLAICLLNCSQILVNLNDFLSRKSSTLQLIAWAENGSQRLFIQDTKKRQVKNEEQWREQVQRWLDEFVVKDLRFETLEVGSDNEFIVSKLAELGKNKASSYFKLSCDKRHLHGYGMRTTLARNIEFLFEEMSKRPPSLMPDDTPEKAVAAELACETKTENLVSSRR